jgi:hypothetical protein
MFQYAVGRRLAHAAAADLRLDLNWFSASRAGDTPRSYGLDVFCIEERFASNADVAALTNSLSERLLRRFPRFAENEAFYRWRTKVTERHFGFDPVILSLPDQRYLVGYWQSEKYFADIEPVLRRELCFREPLGETCARLADEIRRCEAISLHVRRGDYVSSPATARFHGVCSCAYYQRAIATVVGQIPAAHFFVFSDDVDWARSNLAPGRPTTWVERVDPERDYEHLQLMSLCKHHIIANSSFSWWGAWLSDNPSKLVIAPRQWFADPMIVTKDLIPKAWQRI